MKYRAEIDGLRALAVLPVILFHAGFEFFSGGFVGVDIFFVISGYLITTILVDDIENNRFSLINFYERRARRILPALYLVCMFTVILAWLTFDLQTLRKFGNALIGVGTFLSNVVFWRAEGYFDESAELNPLLHTWSLAVEEQYYVVFPVFLFLAWRFGKSITFWMIIVFALLSLSLGEWGWRNSPAANFYLAPSRMWELLAGSISAFIVQKYGVRSSNLFSLVGIVAIILAVFAYDESTPFPSLYTLLPVIGVVLLILFADKSSLIGRLLSNKVLVRIGLLSYALYLWHQPLLAVTRLYYADIELDPIVIAVVLIATGALSYLTWRYVEAPFRNKQFLKRSQVLGISFFALLSLIFIGFLARLTTDGYEDILAEELSSSNIVYFQNMNERRFIFSRLSRELKPVKTVLVGSSRIMSVDSSIFNEASLNISVSGASIEDDIAFSAEAIAQLQPNRLIIGADPWLLNRFDNQDRWTSIESLYSYWIEEINKNKNIEASSTPYFSKKILGDEQSSNLYRLYKKINIKGDLKPTNSDIEAIAKKTYDGQHIYGQNYANKSEKAILAEFDSLLNYAMNNYEFDQDAKEKLIDMVVWAQKNNVEVSFLLSPYHPDLYDRMVKEKPIFLDIEEIFRVVAKKYNVGVFGSYDPVRIGCIRSEFYDGMHPKEECMTKVLSDMTK